MLLSLEVEKMNLKRFPGGGGDFEKDCKIMELSLVNSDNERDSVLLNRFHLFRGGNLFLEGLAIISRTRLSNNRSVMPLDVLGRTRATLNESASFSLTERYG